MALRNIVLHPDPRLKQTTNDIVEFNDDLKRLADDMLETMYDAPGVGLAAPQVGEGHRLFVMDCSDAESDQNPMVLINPTITWQSDELNEYNEGCLSLPELFADVTRPASVKMHFFDPEGREHEELFEGLWATCAQHELDHLNGVLFIDHLSRMKRQMMTRKMTKYKKEMARS